MTDDIIKILDDKATEEFKGVLEYDEIIEKITDAKSKDILREIQGEQSVHVLKIAAILSDMGKEASVIQKMEDYFSIEDVGDNIVEPMKI